MHLTELQAYIAMFKMLNLQCKKNSSYEIRDLLGIMQLLVDGAPVDSRIWDEWLQCIYESLRKDAVNDLYMVLTKPSEMNTD